MKSKITARFYTPNLKQPDKKRWDKLCLEWAQLLLEDEKKRAEAKKPAVLPKQSSKK